MPEVDQSTLRALFEQCTRAGYDRDLELYRRLTRQPWLPERRNKRK